MQLRSTFTALTATVLTLSAVLGSTAAAHAATPAPTASSTPRVTTTPTVTASPRTTGRPSTTATPSTTTAPRATATPKATAAPAPVAAVTTPAPAPVPAPVLTTAPAPVPTPTPTPVLPLPTASSISRTSGRTTVTRVVTLTGTHFENLGGVSVGTTAVTDLVILDAAHARFTVPIAADYQAGPKAIALRAGSDWQLRPTKVAYTYTVRTKVEREMAYAFQNWNRTSSARFGYIIGNDCANFTSQTLLARGWKPSTQWYDAGLYDWSSTWVSSTAMSAWLHHRPDLATHLNYRQRDAVVVGDIVQFHWGWGEKQYRGWDHTAIVSKVVVLPNGRHDIYYVAHTNNSRYGGSTGYFAAHYSKHLRIQFWHLS